MIKKFFIYTFIVAFSLFLLTAVSAFLVRYTPEITTNIIHQEATDISQCHVLALTDLCNQPTNYVIYSDISTSIQTLNSLIFVSGVAKQFINFINVVSGGVFGCSGPYVVPPRIELVNGVCRSDLYFAP